MPTIVFTPTHSLALIGATANSTTLSWTGTFSVEDSTSRVVDQGDDGSLTTSVDTVGESATYTGFVVTIGGEDFGVFEVGGNYFIPYNDGINDISLTLTGAGSTTTIDNSASSLANCFVEGTLIETAQGPRQIESLNIGDTILTAEGAEIVVKWIGRQVVRSAAVNLMLDERLSPVCIHKDAFGPDLPHSDLFVSADHGMILDGIVVNAGALVNGETIRFVPVSELPQEFTYYHIETEAHVVILANGAASETFVDVAGRAAFDNYQEYLDLYGTERIIPEMRSYRITTQRLLPESIKRRLGIARDETSHMRHVEMN